MIKFALLLMFLNAQTGQIEHVSSQGVFNTIEECGRHEVVEVSKPHDNLVWHYECQPIVEMK